MLHVDIQQSMEWCTTVNPDFMSEVTELDRTNNMVTAFGLQGTPGPIKDPLAKA